MRRMGIFYLKVGAFIIVSFSASILCFAWANAYKGVNYPKVAGFSTTAPTTDYLQPVGGVDLNELLVQTNQERSSNGLPALIAEQGLYQSAKAKCQDMTQKHYWAHYAPDGKSGLDFIKNEFPSYFKIAENLAVGYNNATEVTAGWMQSATHRSAILNKNYLYIGFSVCTGDVGYGPDSITIVQHFLAPQP